VKPIDGPAPIADGRVDDGDGEKLDERDVQA